MTHAEFCERWEQPEKHPAFHAALLPAKTILHRFAPAENPHFWLRLVGYAYACEWFYRRACADAARAHRLRWVWNYVRGRKNVKYTSLGIPIDTMLRLAMPADGDVPAEEGAVYLAENADRYKARFEKIIATAL